MHATQSTLPPGPAPAIADLSLIRSPETRAGRKALDRGDWPAVRKFCLQRLTRDDSDAFAHRYLGTALAALGDLEQAREAFDQALAVYPNDPVVLVNGADLAARQMDHDRAYELSKRATVAAPSIVKGWVILLSACYLTGRHEEAIEAAATVLAMPMDNKSRQVATNNLAINLRDLGRMDEAMAAVREAIRLDPTWTVPYMNQLLFMLSMPDVTAMDMKQVAREFAMQSEDPYKASWPRFENHNADPHRRLRVGFLSPDFNAHSVMYFVEGLLPHLDRNQFEVVALYLQSADHLVTQRVRRHCDEFHALNGLDDGTLFERLKALDIDILIDLAGHTAASGLGAMARKPAPVQATWLGFPATTGLTAIDWRLTDSCT
ncbi:MAG: tetratricopeptide repeat protein, partial [Rhodoferax sp.]|nr:tetratricopeptide repeat protein [Rhodoferax sp.]